MPKMTPYEKGRKREYEAKQRLESWFNCYVIRSAGSHTPIDLIAGNRFDVYTVQVKSSSTVHTVNWDELREWAEAFKAEPMVMEKCIGGRWRIYIDEKRYTPEGT